MSRRGQVRFDYLTYNISGIKVPKVSSCVRGFDTSFEMGDKSLKIREKQISQELNTVFATYTVDELDQTEISEFVGFLRDLGQQFRYIHAELESELDDEYGATYPNFEKMCKKIIDTTKACNTRLKKLIHDEQINSDKQRSDNAKDALKIREQVFQDKLSRALDNFDTEDIDVIKENCQYLSSLVEEFYEIFRDVKVVYRDDDFQTDFSDRFETTFITINDKIKFGRDLIRKLHSGREEAAVAEREKMDGEAKAGLISEQKALCGVLLREIETRRTVLICKCDVDALDSLSDHQILGFRKMMSEIDCELRELMEKVTEYSKILASCEVNVDEALETPRKIQEECLECRNIYAKRLHRIITENDISEEKLKASSNLTIDVPKFSGYDSKLDIFSFKSEFEKNVQHTILKKFWVDTLKKNYLSGSAATLVEKCETMAEIWSKLTEAYGNVKLLLQNKIDQLDKIESLSSIRSDEKLAIAISKIVNMMTDLSNLAAKHDLENKLYIGGGLERVVSLLGNVWERRFFRKNLELTRNSPDSSSGVLVSKSASSDGASDSATRSDTDTVSEGSSDSRSRSLDELSREKLVWKNLKDFLMKEASLCEQLALVQRSKDCLGIKNKTSGKSNPPDAHFTSSTSLTCPLCGEDGHVVSTDKSGRKHIDYVACKLFAQGSPKFRRDLLQKFQFCFQCLIPGIKFQEDHVCPKRYNCPHSSHASYEKGIHVLLCERHKGDAANVQILAQYMKSVISKRASKFETFTNNISLCCLEVGEEVSPDVEDNSAILMLQTIDGNGVSINACFDSACRGSVIRWALVEALSRLGRAECIQPGPLTLIGVGNKTTVSRHGEWSVTLPLRNGRNVKIKGIVLDEVTSTFPEFELSRIESDIRAKCRKHFRWKNKLGSLPRLPKVVGGSTDILIGARYSSIHPIEVWRLNGIRLYDSRFSSLDGSSGVVWGSHPDIDRQMKNLYPEDEFGHIALESFFVHEVSEMRQGDFEEREVNLFCAQSIQVPDFSAEKHRALNVKFYDDVYLTDEALVSKRVPDSWKLFEEVENAGTEVTYRCIVCSGCTNCTKGPRIEELSIQEEIEQGLIDRCVEVDLDAGTTTGRLPFLSDPDARLSSNESFARKIYNGQVRNLAKSSEDRDAVIQSEKSWQDLGYVDYLEDLPSDVQDEIMKAPVQYVIPWRIVWKPDSQTTPIRIVLDATASPRGGCSLNSILAKGSNNMNSLIAILIRWVIRKYAYHTDIKKCYNSVRLHQSHWRYHLYLWSEDLKPETPPKLKVLKTFIYGVKPSGNVAECGIRKTADMTKDIYPKAHSPIHNDTYVDDCASGEDTEEERVEVTDQLSAALNTGGFYLKGFTFSGFDPPSHLSADGESIFVGGLKWYSREDTVSINLPDQLNFSKKKRGRKSEEDLGVLPSKLTMRDCVSKVWEIYDPYGWIAPVTAAMKQDIRTLTMMNLDWDDAIPDSLREVWTSHFEMMKEIGSIRFQRAVVPEDAVDTCVETIDVGDASQTMICVAIYARFRRKSGGFSCQLVFSRSKVVPRDMSVPRAELLAASLNASTGFVVRKAFGDQHQGCYKLTDSQVALHWIGSPRTKLKTWARNRVVECNRLSNIEDWRYVESRNNISDLGTKKGARLADVGPDSEWINGMAWMRGDEDQFPLKDISEVILGPEGKREARKEYVTLDSVDDAYFFDHICLSVLHVPEDVGLRYRFSQYLVDPNRFRFRKVVRVLAFVFLFLRKMGMSIDRDFSRTGSDSSTLPSIFDYRGNKFVCVTISGLSYFVELPEVDLKAALRYFFEKATAEVKHFTPKRSYDRISEEVDGLLFYSGRILPSQKIGGQVSLADVSFDLSPSTFFVPLVDRLSPIAYAIAEEVHWYHPDVCHLGVESILRETNAVSYIVGGRQLIRDLKSACVRCRVLQKKAVKAMMGPRHDSNLCIAPAFHTTQVDICGPFDSYSNVNKRATVKVWIVVFCCTATSAVDSKIMEDYSTDSFILAFIRFSCRYGYPKNLFPDYGSQLLKGCKDMVLSFSNIKARLSVEFGVNCDPCPVGAHYVHGKVERKIQQVQKSMEKVLGNRRLSILQWESLIQQISNSINNLPIGLPHYHNSLENLDLITPNRLLLGRNNNRSPTAPLELSGDPKKIIKTNSDIFKVWFSSWLVSYVPSLVKRPKWFDNDRNMAIGDVVLFLKSDKEFDKQYQYGIVVDLKNTRDGRIRTVDVEYQNHHEGCKRVTTRGVRELIVIHPIDEIGLNSELHQLSQT